MLGYGFDHEFDFGITPAARPHRQVIRTVFAQLSGTLEVPAILRDSPRTAEPHWVEAGGVFHLVCDTATSTVEELVGMLGYLERCQRKMPL